MKQVLLLLLLQFTLTAHTQTTGKTPPIPQNAKLISQSCTQTDLFITLIDLDTNEMVIVRYGIKKVMSWTPDYELVQVIRTGIKLNPQLQGFVQGQDSPPAVKEEEERTNREDE